MFRALLLSSCVVLSLGLGCDVPVGMEDGTITESALSASSEINKWHAPTEGRLNNYKGKGLTIGVGAWCADKTAAPHYLQIDLGSVRNIGMIATQGRNNTSNQYVKSYSIRFSEDGGQWETIPASGDEKVFAGNTDKNSIVYNNLPGVGQAASIQARFIRVIPVDYNINICMRVELYECPAPTTEPPTETSGPTTQPPSTTPGPTTQPSTTTPAPTTEPPTTPPACPECPHGCVATPGGYNCTCPSGYQLHMDGKTCEDINECSDGTHTCQQNCSNTNGSYTCSCMPGYKLLSNKKSCQDIDECSDNTDGCAQTCLNSAGSFSCDCYSGYTLGNDGKSCSDIDECTQGTDNCDKSTTECLNKEGTYQCPCLSGYKRLSDSHKCTDIDECSDNTDGCAQMCLNSMGSFSCDCYSGYTLGNDGKSCNDIDECAQGTDNCDKSTTECSNTMGWYQCPCLSGYKRLSDIYKCSDIDECDSGVDQCDISTSYCENLVGDYQCNCRGGFERDTKLRCKDVDECKNNNGDCSDGCSNSVGSYTCTCPDGYKLDASLKNCVDKDECLDSKGGCKHECHNTVGSFYCSCDFGYKLKADKLSCEDIDECTEGSDTCDKTSTTCNNLSPLFECICKVGYTPIVGDKLKCKANTCTALVEAAGTIVSPSSCLQNNVREVGETCVFTCEPGYELPNQQDTMTCQPSGSWDIGLISCQKRSCPKLSAPANGNLFPDQCETTGNVFQEKCHYSCNNGYDLIGVQVKTCGSDGQWDDQSEPTCTLALPDPWITCPGSVIVTLSPGASTADVSALLGDPDSNQPPSSIQVLPAQYNSNKTFPVGTTTITYVATNPVGKTAQCQTSVLVQDKEAPKIVGCPLTIYEVRESGDQAVSWTEPRITDNVGVASSSSSKKPGDTFTFGETNVKYTAKDASNNSASCSFKVVLKKLECVDPDPPDNGGISCSSFCSLSCDANKIQFEVVFFLTCTNGQWNAEVPDCVDFTNPNSENICPTGYVKQVGGFTGNYCVKCPRGRYYNTTSKTCIKCPVGYISTAEGSLECQKCPDKSSTSVEGSKECTAQCLPGYFSASGLNLPGNLLPCQPCPNNTYQDKLGQSGCERCPNDTETLNSGSTNVSDCGAPPVVTDFKPNPLTAFENNQTQFECLGEGLPLPSFAIEKVVPRPPGFGSPFKLEYIQGNDGHLKGIRYILTKVTEYDEGAYNCTVTNEFGSDTKYLHVSVELDFSIGKRRRR